MNPEHFGKCGKLCSLINHYTKLAFVLLVCHALYPPTGCQSLPFKECEMGGELCHLYGWCSWGCGGCWSGMKWISLVKGLEISASGDQMAGVARLERWDTGLRSEKWWELKGCLHDDKDPFCEAISQFTRAGFYGHTNVSCTTTGWVFRRSPIVRSLPYHAQGDPLQGSIFEVRIPCRLLWLLCANNMILRSNVARPPSDVTHGCFPRIFRSEASRCSVHYSTTSATSIF